MALFLSTQKHRRLLWRLPVKTNMAAAFFSTADRYSYVTFQTMGFHSASCQIRATRFLLIFITAAILHNDRCFELSGEGRNAHDVHIYNAIFDT